MPLNLGSIIEDQNTRSTDEMIYDFLELCNECDSLENAYMIAKKAMSSQSMECLSFAEELLGASCEVVAEKTIKEMARKAVTAIKQSKSILERLKHQAESMLNRDNGYVIRLQDRLMPVSEFLIDFAKSDEWGESISRKRKSISAYKAVEIVKDVATSLLNTIRNVSNFSTIRSYRDAVASNHPGQEHNLKVMSGVRRQVKFAIAECNRIIKNALQIGPSRRVSIPSPTKVKQRQGPYPDYAKTAMRSDGSTTGYRHSRTPW